MLDEDLETFVENYLDNVVTLFGVFNKGTHPQPGGSAWISCRRIKRRGQLSALTAVHLQSFHVERSQLG